MVPKDDYVRSDKRRTRRRERSFLEARDVNIGSGCGDARPSPETTTPSLVSYVGSWDMRQTIQIPRAWRNAYLFALRVLILCNVYTAVTLHLGFFQFEFRYYVGKSGIKVVGRISIGGFWVAASRSCC
jgi:hypothetical protein